MIYFIISTLCLLLAVAMFIMYCYDRYQVISLGDEIDRVRDEKNIVIEFLHKTAEDISADADRVKLYRHIVRATALSCGAMSACVYEKQPNGSLKAKAVEGLFPPQVSKVPRQKANQLRSEYLENAMAEETVEPNEGIIGEVAASFKGVLIKDGSKDPRVVKHEDESFKVRSIIVVPMVFGGQLYGVLAVANPISGKPFTETDFSLAKSLGEQSGLAIHNSEAVSALIEKSKLEFDLKLASSVQRFLLPARLPQSSELECAVKYRPQKLIGGDFYDFIKLEDDRLGVVIGDVSGKGVSAAILMALCQTTLRYIAPNYSLPSDALKALNAEMVCATRSDMFITMIYAIIDTRNSTITLARAGHERPLLCRRINSYEAVAHKIKSSGMAVGMVDPELFDESIEDKTLDFKHGDVFVLYTDCVTEAVDKSGNEYSAQKLAHTVSAMFERSASEITREIIKSVERFTHKSEYLDDLTLLTIKRL